MSELQTSITPQLWKRALSLRLLLRWLVNYLFLAEFIAFVLWVVIAIIDTTNNQGVLIGQHGIALAIAAAMVAGAVALYEYRNYPWDKTAFALQADDKGLTGIVAGTSSFMAWSGIRHYREFKDYFILELASGRLTVIPNTAEAAGVIALLRQFVPSYRQTLKTSLAGQVSYYLREVRGLAAFLLITAVILIALALLPVKAPPLAAALIDNPEQYLGKQLTVTPGYGYGWSNSQGDSIDTPSAFVLELQQLEYDESKAIGGVGKVVTVDHAFSELWVRFSLRRSQQVALTAQNVDYNVIITSQSLGSEQTTTAVSQGNASTSTRYAGWVQIQVLPDAQLTTP
jgi:hypothetical protein